MFEFIIGDLVAIKDDYIVVQNNKIGYKIFTSTNSIIRLELGMKEIIIYTYLNVREDGIFLFGFVTEEEMDMFKLLLLVSKIGPKIAIGILSSLRPSQIKMAIIKKDLDLLCQAPGIGKKTAERMVLELKDRIDKDIDYEEDFDSGTNNNYQEASEALISLGYKKYEVDRILRKLDVSNLSVEEIIRETLKILSKD